MSCMCSELAEAPGSWHREATAPPRATSLRCCCRCRCRRISQSVRCPAARAHPPPPGRFLPANDPHLQKLRQYAANSVTWFRHPYAQLVLVRARAGLLRIWVLASPAAVAAARALLPCCSRRDLPQHLVHAALFRAPR